MSVLPRSLFNGNGILYYKDTLPSMDLKELISQCRNGDEKAINLLYNTYYPKMVKVCAKIVGNHMTAEELAHDAFILAISKLDQLKEPQRFERWLSSISSNVALRYVTRVHIPKTISLDELPEDELVKSASQNSIEQAIPPIEVLMAAINNLPEGYSKVFKMSIIQGMSHAEIAEMLGIAAHSSSSQLARAKKLLRKSLSTYWALLVALLLIPIAYFFFRQSTKRDTQQPIITKQDESNKHQKIQPNKKVAVDSTDNTNQTPVPTLPPSHPNRIYTKQYLTENAITKQDSATTHKVDSTYTQPADTSSIDTSSSSPQQPTIISPNRDIFITENDDEFILPITDKGNSSKWGLNLAYSGNFSNNPNNISPFEVPLATLPTTGWPPPDSNNSPFTDNWYELYSNLYYWKEEYEWDPNYYEEEGPDLTIEELNALLKIAEANIEAGNEKITRESHHDLPFTFSFALKHQLNKRWSIESGLMYSHLSSQFITGKPFAGIIDNQEIHYIGIPLKGSYNWINSRTWSLYTSFGATIEIPVNSKFTTDFMLNGTSLLHQKQSLDVPLQWSVGIGIGLQYNITPQLGIFAEPSFQYYIPDGSDIETYRTEHPYNFSLPIGFRFSW